MYTSFFGLDEKPFAITPDPRYLYLSEQHAEALAHLTYGIKEAGGFIQLTGEVGTGKTTIVRSLLQQLPANCDVALILNPTVSPVEFLLAICDELHVSVPPESRGSLKDLFDLLSRILLKAHHIIEHANAIRAAVGEIAHEPQLRITAAPFRVRIGHPRKTEQAHHFVQMSVNVAKNQ